MKNKNMMGRLLKGAAALALSGLMVLSGVQSAYAHAYERYMEYAYGDKFSDGLVVFKGKDGRLGYMDAKGKVVIQAKYNGANDFFGGMTLVGNDKVFGYINKKGEQKIDLQKKGYNFAYVNFRYGKTMVTKEKGQKVSIMDKNGKILGTTKDKYDRFGEGDRYLVVLKNGKYGLIDEKGNVILKPKYDEINWEDDFTHNVCFKKDNKWGLLNQKGEVLIKAKYDEGFWSNEGLIPVSKNGKWGFIDAKSFETVLEFKYDKATHFMDGKAVVKMDDKWQMIDKSGEVISEIEGEYEDIGMDTVGVYVIQSSDDKWGIMDKDGNVVVKPKYLERLSFDDGTKLARAIRKDNKCGFINTKGETVLKFK